MKSSTLKRARIAAMIFLGIFLTSGLVCTTWAATGGIPWQVGDVVICFGGGQCNVVRIRGNSVQLLDSLSDASPVGSGGNTFGAALNNTLHLLATDDGGGGQSKVVVYSIASVNPFTGATLTHSVINTPYNAGGTGESATAMAVNSAGHIFVGNSNTGGASIVELNANGSPAGHVFTFPTTGTCATTTLNSLDISATADAIYVTAKDGIIRKVSLPLSGSSSCAQFANFGSGVTLFGIKDIPAGALNGTCGSNPPNPTNNPCPSGESVLVVATGFTDPDDATTNETGEPPLPNDPDAVNICTNQTDQTPVSCGLLLDTAGAGLTAQPWVANNLYGTAGVSILDPHSHVQQVLTPGTSGANEPPFGQSTTTIDNAVKWTDITQPSWKPSKAYVVGALPAPAVAAVPDTYFVDTNGNLETVTTAGTSGPNEPTWPVSGTTIDGLVWTDQGAVTPWTPITRFNIGTLFVDSQGFVQRVTTVGTSTTPSQPTWNETPGNTTTDGLVWADQGPAAPAWQMNTPYAVGTTIEDPAGHLQMATNNGVSGPSQPNFDDNSGTTTDGNGTDPAVVWQDQGPAGPAWQANTTYQMNATIEDSSGNLEKAISAGKSGAGNPPAFNHGVNATTIDNAVIWTNQGGPAQSWSAGHPFALNTFITEGSSPKHVQKVTEAGTSGGTTPTFDHSLGTTIDGAVIWTESHPSRGATQAYVLNAIVLDTFSPTRHVQQVSLAGTTGPAVTFAFSDSGATETDGLQWTDQPMPSVLARYPVASVTTLKSLALDPLVSNCTGSSGTACATVTPPARMVTNSNPFPVAPSFWFGDYGSGTIYRQNFAGGAATPFTGTCPAGCGIQSLVVYGGESANQPGLASLVLNGTLNVGDSFTTTANFFQNTITSTLSNNSGGPPLSTAISLYASRVDKTSCFNDPVAGSLPCKATDPTDSTKAFIWKIDLPLNGNMALPTTETLNTAIAPPTGTFDNSTDVFVDEQFDDTTFVGNDPGTRTISVHSLHEVPVTFSQTQAQCTYSIPLQNGCYKTNRNTLNFIFTCSGLTPTQLQGMHPSLGLVKKNPPQAPLWINLGGTNGKAPYRFAANINSWTFQWNLNGATGGTYQGTTFDTTGVQSFPVTFVLKNSCP